MASSSSVCIVLDGANVATRKDGQRAIPRLAAALAFFTELQQTRQCPLRCIAFVPNFWLNTKPADASKGNGSMETDDWEQLQSLVDKELVVLTPSHAHDDFYVIDYAVKNDGFIVTNDMFRDHVDHKRVFQGRRLTQKWTRERCIDFTFVGNEFLPNSQAIEKTLVHQPRPHSPRDTITATVTTMPSVKVSTSESTSTPESQLLPKPTTTKPQTPRVRSMRSSSLTKSIETAKNSQEEEEEEEEENESSMAVDHVRKRQVDLSELTPYRVPRYLLPLLHGDDSQTMKRFMDHTNTYIVAPTLAPSATSEIATLSIYGTEPNRLHAVKILDAALPELHQQYEFQMQQQQQQQWLFAQQQQQQFQQTQHPHDDQHQQFLQQQQLQRQHYQQHQHQHPPANYPLQHQHPHQHVYNDDRMDIEL